jgi:hypothetical protein
MGNETARGYASMKTTLSTVLGAAHRRKLPCLLIGGNAVIHLGYQRLTLDIDLLVPERKRSQWLDLMRELGFRFLYGTEVFAQFQPGTPGMAPVDLMFVDAATWKTLDSEAREEIVADQPVRVPRVEHLIALKLHAAASPHRDAREQDWQDIRQMVRACHLNPADEYFREIILRYGGQEAMNRILSFSNET